MPMVRSLYSGMCTSLSLVLRVLLMRQFVAGWCSRSCRAGSLSGLRIYIDRDPSGKHFGLRDRFRRHRFEVCYG